jgi:manganese oxidase
MRKGVATLLAALAVTGVAACGADSKSAAREANVVMELIAFKPAAITIKAGSAVTWTQKDAGVHTVTSGVAEQQGGGVTERPDGKFDSGEIATGKTFTFTFDAPGTFAYFCRIHPATMRGSVTVN